MSDEYHDCDHDWSAYHCEYEEETIIMEACNKCFRVNPHGLFIELKRIIRKEILEEAGLNVDVILETDSEKITRMDEMLRVILNMLTETIEQGEEPNGEHSDNKEGE